MIPALLKREKRIMYMLNGTKIRISLPNPERGSVNNKQKFGTKFNAIKSQNNNFGFFTKFTIPLESFVNTEVECADTFTESII